jgi:hypothetical protein
MNAPGTQVFNSVWFLPSENTWQAGNLLAFRDVGRLTIGGGGLVFEGQKGRVAISRVQRLSIGKQGRDFMNDWVKVEYGDPPHLSSVYFADGSLLGWGGLLGGTRRIFSVVQQMIAAASF